jgi:hypothetical protein
VKADIDNVGMSGEVLPQGLGGFLPLHGQVRHRDFNDILVEGKCPFYGDDLALEGESCAGQFLEVLVVPEAQFDGTVSRDCRASPPTLFEILRTRSVYDRIYGVLVGLLGGG